MNLTGKNALITGGTKGIGKAIALKLAEHGANIAMNYFKSRNTAEETLKEIQSKNKNSFLIRGNVGNPEHIDKMFELIREKFGVLNILISNAAAGSLKSAGELTIEDWQTTMDINARAFLLLASKAVKIMPAGGKIIAITSLGPRRYIPKYAAVGSAKAALETLTRYLAVELAPQGINVNAVAAGIVETESLRMFPDYDLMIRYSKEKTPFARIGRPEDIAPVVAFLCSDYSNWITGQVIVADGGYSLI